MNLCFYDVCFNFFDPTASATAYGQRPKFAMAEHSATAEGENCAYGPTLRLNISPELLLCMRTNERTVVRQTVHSLNCHSWDHYHAYRDENIYLVHQTIFVQQWASTN